MAVFLSPVGGAAAQFFDNNGIPLAGGLIYTYAAGTSTPAATYTTSAGTIQHSNPIILDASGRVPTGEIWLGDTLAYKFVVKDYNDVLIATYDNITGINSNFVAFTSQQEIQTATAGQTVFNLTTMQYQPATNNLSVFVDGVNQYGPGAQYAYTETDSDTVTFVSGLHIGASVKFTTASPVASAVVNAENVSYTYPAAGAVAESVEARLAQYVSVKDFGAVGDGVTDDTVAIQNAIDACDSLYFPIGKYKVSSLTIDKTIKLYGSSSNGYTAISAASPISLSTLPAGSIIYCTSTSTPALNLACTEKRTGLEICGLIFYYEQSSYLTPTAYPRTISDENATSGKFWNGVKIHDCCFLNTYSGINLQNCSFADVYNISGTFLYRGIEFNNHTDTSRINNVHFSNFTNSADAYTFMRSSSSSNALYLTNCDEVYVSEISTFKRQRGAFIDGSWFSLTTATFDEVGECIVIANQSTIAGNVSDVKINCNSDVALATAIWMSNTASVGDNSITLSDITIRDSGTGTYALNTGIRFNMANLIADVNDVQLEYAAAQGILIEQGDIISISDVKFTNFWPNQASAGGYDLTTVGIRNNAASTKLQLTNIIADDALEYVYDGYSTYVTFDRQESIFETKPYVNYNTMSGPVTGSVSNGIRQTSFTDNDATGAFQGIQMLSNYKRGQQYLIGNYYVGAWYKTTAGITTAANDTRCIGMPRPANGIDLFIPVDTSAQSAMRVSIVRFTSSNAGQYSAPYARRFNGTLIVYGAFAVKSETLAVPFQETDDLVTAAAPTSTISYFAVQDRYSNSVPTAGQPKAWVCTVAGTPGTWVSEGNL